jgi:acyl dehydratase
MPFDPAAMLALPPRETVAVHDARDVMLYALGVGVAIEEPTGAEALMFACERDLRVLPTMAAVMAWPGFWLAEPRFGIDWKRLLHGEQSLRIHAPLPVAGEIVSRLVIVDIYDKGADKGAVLYSRRDLHDRASDRLLATEIRGAFLRGNGGQGGRRDAAPAPHAIPARPADAIVALPTRADQALLYRLSGDYNPLHADPAIAAAAGFSKPILHGLCTYGVAGRALLRELCANDTARFRRMDCRFSAPVYPGETIVTEIWREGSGSAAFRARAKERDVVVLDNGYAEFG